MKISEDTFLHPSIHPPPRLCTYKRYYYDNANIDTIYKLFITYFSETHSSTNTNPVLEKLITCNTLL